jgi:hypothetical protein
MNEPTSNPQSSDAAAGDDLQTALFLDLVAQHAEMALMFLGRVPHPQTGEKVQDLETARLFISQLEMIEAKTKGNLSPREAALLKQGLMATRMAFVEVVEAQGAKPDAGKEPGADPVSAGGPSEPSTAAAAPEAPEAPEASTPAQENSPSETDEERKKFVKKY